jgi:hypothetical protein
MAACLTVCCPDHPCFIELDLPPDDVSGWLSGHHLEPASQDVPPQLSKMSCPTHLVGDSASERFYPSNVGAPLLESLPSHRPHLPRVRTTLLSAARLARPASTAVDAHRSDQPPQSLLRRLRAGLGIDLHRHGLVGMAQNPHDHARVYLKINKQGRTGPPSIMHCQPPDAGVTLSSEPRFKVRGSIAVP